MKNTIKKAIVVIALVAFTANHANAQEVNCLTTDGAYIYAGIKEAILKISHEGDSIRYIKIKDPNADKLQVNKLAVYGALIVAVSNSNDLFLSHDSGASWKQIFLANKDSAVYIDAIATDGATIFVSANSSLYKSNDKGASWKKDEGINKANIFCIKIIASTVYAGGNIEEHQSEKNQHRSVLYVSTNKGESWKRIDNGLTETVAEVVAADTSVFAGTLALGSNTGALYRLNRKSSTWSALKAGNVASLEVISKTILAAFDHEGAMISKDNGTNWAAQNTGLKRIKRSYNISFLTSLQSTIYGVSNGYLYISTDNGEHWAPTKESRSVQNDLHSDFKPNCIVGTGTHAFAGGEWGVYEMVANANKKIDVTDNKYFDGTNSLNLAADGRYDIQVITLNNTGPGIFAQVKWGYGNNLYQSYDNGATWKTEPSLMGTRTTTYGEIYEGGKYWYLTQNHILFMTSKKTQTKVLALVRNGDLIFAGSDNGIFRLRKGKDDVRKYGDYTKWTNDKVDLRNDSVTSICLSGEGLFVGTKKGLFVSNDKGETYSPVNLNKPRGIFSLQANGTDIFAGTTGGVFVSHDSGKTWALAEDGFAEDAKVSSLAIAGATIYAQMKGILFVSFNNGDDWEQAVFNKIFKYRNIVNDNYEAEKRKPKVYPSYSTGTYHGTGYQFHALPSRPSYNPNPSPSQIRMWGSQNARYH